MPQPVDILWPLGGLDRQLGFQHQKPYTTGDCLNVRPRDVFQRRMRGGSRPGLRKAFLTQLAGTSVDLMADVREVAAILGNIYDEPFNASLTTPPWSPATWRSHNGDAETEIVATLPDVTSGYARFPVGTGKKASMTALRDALTIGIDNTKEHRFTISGYLEYTGSPSNSTHTYFGVWLRMNDTAPNGTSTGGVLVAVEFSNAQFFTPIRVFWGLSVYVYNASGVLAETYQAGFSQATVFIASDWTIDLRVNSGGVANAIDVTATGTIPDIGPFTISRTLTTAAAGARFGLVALRREDTAAAAPTSEVRWNNFTLTYTGGSSPLSGIRNRIAAIAGGAAKLEDNAGTLSVVTVTTAPTAGRLLQATDLRGKLYITNYTGADTDTFLVLDPGGGAATLKDVVALVGGAAPNVPVKCELITSYRDALVLAGQRGNANEWHICKRGVADPATNAAWVADATSTSYTLGSTSEAGRVGEPITALIRHSNDYLIFGCQNSLWILRGEPNFGGTLDILASRNGVVSATAWCRGPNDYTFYLSHDGLYGVGPGGQTAPEPLSYGLPDELRNINVQQNRIFIAYDVIENGVYVAVTRIDGSAGKYFFFDMLSKRIIGAQEFASPFPDRFNCAFEPTFLYYYGADAPEQRGLLFGGRDGYIRTFDRRASTDDGLLFQSYADIGPIALGGGGYYDGMLREYVGQLAVESGDMTAEVKIGNSIEAAFNATPRFPMPLRAGKNLTYRPNLRGNACFIRLSSANGAATAMENQTIVRERLGKQRL